MHVVKNVTECLTGTLFNIKGKTKDTWKSRKDLMDKGLKKSLHLVEDGNSFIMPMACYHFTKDEKQKVLNFLASIKFPDGFASNISRCLKEGELQLSRMKSHDFYIFIQKLLPLSIRGSLTKEARLVLYELSDFIQILCARNMYIDVLEKQEEKIAIILCKLERMFPPSFFDIMTHLLIHLPFEAKKGGPFQYRWMFPFERKMRALKGYVKNTARPKGCIAERSLDNECLNFCSMYLNDVETIFNKVERNNEMVDIDGDISVFSCKGRPLGCKITRDISNIELEKIHTYILNNCDEMVELINEHKLKLEKENCNNINELHDKHFASWLQERVNNCPESFESEIRLLSRGPLSVNKYSGCMVNGFKFHINLVVLEEEYLGQNKRVLVFKYNWFRVSDVRGLQVDKESAVISINMQNWHSNGTKVIPSQLFNVPVGRLLSRERRAQLNHNVDLNLEQFSLRRGSTPLELVDGITFSGDSTGKSMGDVYREEEPQLNLNVDLNLEQFSLRRGSTPLELVDGITFSGDSTGKSSKNHLDDEQTDPSDLESSEKEKLLQLLKTEAYASAFLDCKKHIVHMCAFLDSRAGSEPDRVGADGYSGASWIGKPGGQGTGEPGGQGTRRPVGLSTHESDGRIREPGGPSTRELGGPGTRGPVGLSSRDLQNPVTLINHREEDDQEDTREIDDAQTETDTSDDELEENIGSTSHGKTITRKETRALGETRKSCLNKKNLAFEVDDCSGRIVGDDSQRFITKGGCVMRKFAKLDGTTWKNQPDLLKRDIITKSVENSNFDEGCDNMEQAMQKQLASQHKNKQYKLHLHFKKYPTKEAAMMHPPDGVRTRDWVNLCDRFSSEAFQKISAKNKKNRSFNKVPPAVGSLSVARRVYMKKKKGKEVTAIGMYEIAHYSKKTHKMVNEEAEKVLNGLRTEEANSTLTPAEICLKQLKHIPGHIKGRSASTRNILGNEKLRLDLESEKERSQALEENMKVMNKKQRRLQKQNKKIKGQLKFMMREIKRLSKFQSQTNISSHLSKFFLLLHVII
ncbi:reverse transcriptase domain-containing protein [Tanacetum coccineum]